MFAVILGTGVGGGIVAHGHLLTGPNRLTGEWGHNPLPWPDAFERPGPACYCGQSGCIETWLSGPGMARDHAAFAGEDDDGTQPDARQIGQRAALGDGDCEATLQRYEARLARGLAQVINVLDPDVIVLAGGVSRLDRLIENVPRLWTSYVFSGGLKDDVHTRLVQSQHGDSSGVRGAAWLWR